MTPPAGARRRATSHATPTSAHFYGVDPEDDALYHMVMDSTRLALDVCVEAIAAAALELAD